MVEAVLQDEVAAASTALKAVESALAEVSARESECKVASARAQLTTIAWKASQGFRRTVDRLEVPRVLPVAVLPLPVVFLAFVVMAELTGLVAFAAMVALVMLGFATGVMAFLSAFPDDHVVARELEKSAVQSQNALQDLAHSRQHAQQVRQEIAAATARLAAAHEAVARDEQAKAKQERAKQEQERQARLAEEARRKSVENTYKSLYLQPWRDMRAGDFEMFLAKVLSAHGYEVEQTGRSGDQGVDLIVTRNGRRVAVQAKGYSGSVGNAAVQEAYAGMAHYRCDACAVVTNSTFTSSAVSLAESTRCLLVHEVNFREFVYGQVDLMGAGPPSPGAE